MAKAKIVGEYHSSSKNVEEFKRMVESKSYDAVFIEDREDKIFDKNIKPGFGYSFFLLGFAEMVALFRLYASKKSIRALAEQLGIPVFTTIDAPLPVLFNMTNVWIRRFLFPILVFLFALLTLYGPFFFRLAGLILLMVSPLLHFAVFVANKKRDDFMANSILEKIRTNNYSNVLVGCGNSHIDGIARNLRQAGVEVDSLKREKSRFESAMSFALKLIFLIAIILILTNLILIITK